VRYVTKWKVKESIKTEVNTWKWFLFGLAAGSGFIVALIILFKMFK